MPKSQVRAGDATGKEKERLLKEHAPEIAAAATTTSLTTPPVVQHTDDVVDYTGGGSPNVGESNAPVIPLERALEDGTVASAGDLPDAMVDATDLPDGKTDVRPEMVTKTEEPRPAHERPQDQPRPVVVTGVGDAQPPEMKIEEPPRILRVNTDLEDITIGKDNHFTFREGVRYKVPAHVYNHLDEKGYVYH